MRSEYELIVIGGGPAGIAAALAAYKNGVKNILIIERDRGLGGILNQCIHNGFGLHHFKEELTGPEYSNRIIDELKGTTIETLLDTMVMKIDADRSVYIVNTKTGCVKLSAKALVLAMGCRERTRGAINICGSRPAGVYTAGMAQRLINLEGYMPGKRVVVLGSGDIGLIMARRMTLEGAKVEAVLEILPYSNGLNRNIVQCLNDYNIPLKLSHTVVQIHGNDRIEGVTIAKVDDKFQPIEETKNHIPCDTLLLSVGLIPENELSRAAGIDIDTRTNGPCVDESRQTNIEGIFACGNVLQVHDLVDFVSEEGAIAGLGAARYIKGELKKQDTHSTVNGDGICYIVPQKINLDNLEDGVKVYMRVKDVYANRVINAYLGDTKIAKKREVKFLPAEMVSFVVKKEELLAHSGDKILFKVEDLD